MSRFGTSIAVAVFCAVALACGVLTWKALAVDSRPKLRRMEFPVNPGHAKVTLAAQLRLPKEAMVYKVKTRPVTEQRMRELIRLLKMRSPDTATAGLRGAAKGSVCGGTSEAGITIAGGGAEGYYNIPDKHESLYLRNDGIVVYTSAAPSHAPAPSEKESIKVAKGFLRRSRLVPPGAKLQLLGVGGSGVQDVNDQGVMVSDIMEVQTPSFWVIRGKGILERSVVDVSVCAGGRVCGLVLNVRDVEPYMKYPLKDQAQIASDLKAGAAFVGEEDTHTDVGADIEIRNYRLAYIEPAYLDRVEYIQPIYYLVGRKSREGKSKAFIGQVAAIRSDYTFGQRKAKGREKKQ